MKYFLIIFFTFTAMCTAEEFKGKSIVFTFADKGVKVKEDHKGGGEIYEISFGNEFKTIYAVRHNVPIKSKSQLKREFNGVIKQITIPVERKTEKQIFKKTKSVKLGDFSGYEYSFLKEAKDKKFSALQVYFCVLAHGQFWDFQCHSDDPKDLEVFREVLKKIKFIKK